MFLNKIYNTPAAREKRKSKMDIIENGTARPMTMGDMPKLRAALGSKAPEVKEGCSRCDTFGGSKTYQNQACLPLNGRVVCIDWCIHQIVAALNAGGVETVACCCGHGQMPGRIDLKDGRILTLSSPHPQQTSQP